MLPGRGTICAKLPSRAPNGKRRAAADPSKRSPLSGRLLGARLLSWRRLIRVSAIPPRRYTLHRAHARTARTSKLYARARTHARITHARTHACATHEHAHAARAHIYILLPLIYMPHASVLLCICVSEGGSRAGGEETKLRGNCLRTRTRNTLHLCESDWLDAFVSECCSTLALRSFGKGSSASRALSSHVKIRRPATRLYFCS